MVNFPSAPPSVKSARELCKAMALLGYTQDVPAGYQLAVECDAEIAAHELCPSCERHGLDYLAFFRGPSYRGVAVCPDCGHADEF
jgi:hypothetical protein